MSDWCNSPVKRAFDLILALILLVVLSPVLILVAVIVKLTSPGPVFFRQTRPGRKGHPFEILKFRTMKDRDEPGPILTRSGDPRLTDFGRLLRRFKLDELPQLFNVVAGHMSFVGPRPQAVKLWAHFVELPLVLHVRPGITGAATLAFRNEEEMLKPLSSEQVEQLYLKYLMPLKMQIDEDYLVNATWKSDLQLIIATVLGVFGRSKGFPGQLVRNMPDFVAFESQLWDVAAPKSPSQPPASPGFVPLPAADRRVSVQEIGD